MCGIFGMIRCENATHPDRASAAFVELGHLAVARGRDAAGFALATGAAPRAGEIPNIPTRSDLDRRDVTIDGIRIIKDVCSFGDLWDDDQHLPLLADARVAIGHTRYATQGNKKALTNASPLLVGHLVGTHNGDVEVASLSDRHSSLPPFGSTDSEILYQSLHRARKDRRKVVKTLTEVEGRAALAWMDRGRADRVYLARAALSPLSIAWDADGNFYWASNPAWFREIDAKFDDAIGFHDITMVREGMLLTVEVTGSKPQIDDMREFLPQSRPSDERTADMIIWRNFDAEDTKADKAQKHRVVAKARYAPVKAWTSAGTAATSLPRYSQTLPGLDDIAFAARSSSSDLVSGEPDFDDPNVEAMISDEVDEAVIAWMEEGYDPRLIERLRDTPTPSEESDFIAEFGFTCAESFRRFREALLEDWDEDAVVESGTGSPAPS